MIIVAAPDFDSELAVKVIQHGADDFVASGRPTHETVARYCAKDWPADGEQVGDNWARIKWRSTLSTTQIAIPATKSSLLHYQVGYCHSHPT